MEWMVVIEGALTSAVGAAIVAVARMLWNFRAEQRAANEEQRQANARNEESIRSMQRAEIMRIFERAVEDGKPLSVEEMDHLEACYRAYHANGGNGTGTLLYEKVKRHAVVSTKALGE